MLKSKRRLILCEEGIQASHTKTNSHLFEANLLGFFSVAYAQQGIQAEHTKEKITTLIPSKKRYQYPFFSFFEKSSMRSKR